MRGPRCAEFRGAVPAGTPRWGASPWLGAALHSPECDVFPGKGVKTELFQGKQQVLAKAG